MRKAAGEEYANTLLRPGTASRFCVAGQSRHTDQCGSSMHANRHSWLHGNRSRTRTNAVYSSPDGAQQQPDPDSPCVIQETAPSFQGRAASHGLKKPSECGDSLQSRPCSVGAHHWRRIGCGQPASASVAASFGHKPLSVQAPSAVSEPLFQQHHVQQESPISSACGLSAPSAAPPVRQSRPRRQHAKRRELQHQSTCTAKSVRDLSTPPQERARSATSRLINPAEIEMSIRKLCVDRSADLLEPVADDALHATPVASISACGIKTGCHPSSSVREEPGMADSPRELSLRGRDLHENVGLGRSDNSLCKGGAGCEDALPPFRMSTRGMGLPDQVDHANAAEPFTHDILQEQSSGEAVKGHAAMGQQLPAHGVPDGNHVKSNDASPESCSNHVTAIPQQLSVVDAYLRLGVSCPGEEAPALQPWNTSAWKSAWEGSGMSGMGRAGLWTLEAINCIVWDRCASVCGLHQGWRNP